MKTYSNNESGIKGIKTGSGIASRIAAMNIACDTKEEYERKFKKLAFVVTPYDTKKDTLR